MQGAVGLKRGFIIGALAAAIFGALLAATPQQAHAITPIPGRIFALTDDNGVQGDLFRTRTNTIWKRLTTGLSFPDGLSAAPNGTFAAICATRSLGGTYRIFRVSANGGPLKNLIGNRQGCGPAVSPDGRQVAYIQNLPTGGRLLRVVSAKGGEPRTIRRFPASYPVYALAWGGKRIFFNQYYDVFSVSARTGKDLKMHTDDRGAARDFQLADVSADGKRLLIVVDESLEIVPNVFLRVYKPGGALVRTVDSSGSANNPFSMARFGPSGPNGVVGFLDTITPPSMIYLIQPGAVWSAGFAGPSVSTAGPTSFDWVKR
ncbi:MAG: TolB family protein [bacterium]